MKINGVTLNKKNFWIPFLVSVGIPFFIILFTLAMLISNEIKKIGTLLVTMLPSSILPLIFVSIPPFFIIKRLLSTKPKKVFYFELPILSLIYSLLGALNMFTGLMFGGPMGMGKLSILIFILSPIPFILLWFSILTVSLYFYYKKKFMLKTSIEKIKTPKSNISLQSFWIPLFIFSILSFFLYFFGNSFAFGTTERVLTGVTNPYLDYLPTYPPFLILTILISIVPLFFIIRRLLSKNPKKVFYFELPVLVIICSFLSNYLVFINFIFGELVDIPILQLLFVLFFIPLFILLWLSLLTISLYFYYKKNNFFRK
ncbi:MAG: hypothetical protein PHQ66_03590 [Candidatus Nanoarchaeia archaeon]|nr:hypothetical protein [Candidatus Nanoarchaeia archaeon]MDD5357555.1 hypothetical protein [Candidatus Nanoarchaeia archaeon]MDD5588474.1 hypothetical protein [Candidatus Nanoarchaeia archaeon]